MKQRTKLKKAISIIILFLMIFNFIDLIIGKSSVFATVVDLPAYDDSSKKEGDLYDNGELQQIDGKAYGVYYDNDGKAHGLEYSASEPMKHEGRLTVKCTPTDMDIAEKYNLPRQPSLFKPLEWFTTKRDDLYIDYNTEGNATEENKDNGFTNAKDDFSESSRDDPLSDFIDGAAGLILYPAKILPLLLGKIIETILGLFSGNGGTLSISDILFNQLEITSVDFFNFNSSDATANNIRENVAIWYYSIRNIAAVALVAIAIYVGIRMAIATVAAEKAKYSSMLVDWLTSIALLFVLHYVMILVININNAFVSAMTPTEVTDVSKEFFDNAWKVGFTEGVGSAIAYLMLVGMTFIFLLSYLKRMITIAFLIIISPLVTVTYSIDKMGDNKSQALNTWLKEFTYNIILQPFQCVTYLAIGNTALNLLASDKSLKTVVIAIAMLFFIYTAEKIVRHIFHMEQTSMSDTIGSAVFASSMLGAIGKGKKSSGGGSSSSDDDAKKKNKAVAARYANPLQNGAGAGASAGAGAGANQRPNLNVAERAVLRTKAAFSNMVAPSENDSNRTAAVKNAVRKVGRGGRKAGGKIKGYARNIGGNKVVRGYLGLNARAAGAIMGIGLGGATGDVKNMFTGVNSFMAKGAEVSDDFNEKMEKSNLNKAMDEYQEATGMSRDEVRQHTVDLMRGDYEGDYTDEDFALKRAADELNKTYSKQGKDSDEVIAAFDKQFTSHEDELAKKIAKQNAKKRYTANFKKGKRYGDAKPRPQGNNSRGDGSRTANSSTGGTSTRQSRNAQNAAEAASKADAADTLK